MATKDADDFVKRLSEIMTRAIRQRQKVVTLVPIVTRRSNGDQK